MRFSLRFLLVLACALTIAGLGARMSSAALTTINGTVYQDMNDNGAYDPGTDIELPAVTVRLYDSSLTQVDQIDTDGSGYYEFQSDPGGGTFYVEVDQSGLAPGHQEPQWLSTTPSIPFAKAVTLADGDTATTDFGFVTENQQTTGVWRINVGSTSPYTDIWSQGWLSDTYNTGGTRYPFGLNVVGTADASLYQTVRYLPTAASSFSYSIPAVNGNYTLKLHFVEGNDSLVVGDRRFNVAMNSGSGSTALLTNYDILSSTGGVHNLALIYKRTGIAITGGTGLSLTFTNASGATAPAIVSAIELLPESAVPPRAPSLSVTDGNTETNLLWSSADAVDYFEVFRTTTSGAYGATPYHTTANGSVLSLNDPSLTNRTNYFYKVRGVNGAGSGDFSAEVVGVPHDPTPTTADLRVNAGGPSFTRTVIWGADQYYSGGATYDGGVVSIKGTTDDTLYRTLRYANTFSYSLPVGNGTDHKVTLHFSEPVAAAGTRPFNITVNGVTQSNYDIMGTNTPVNGDVTIVGGGALNVAADVTFDNIVASGGTGITITLTATGSMPASLAAFELFTDPAATGPAPTSLLATAGNNTVGLTWTAPAGAGVGTTYTVYRNTTGTFTPPTDLLQANVATASYTDNAVTNGTLYYYAVTATPSGGSESGTSNTASAIPVSPGSVLRINSGGSAYTGPNGAWVADSYSTGGSAFNFGNSGSITGTNDPPAFSTVRYGSSFSYTVPVAAGAGYAVQLYFAEGSGSVTTGSRKFNVAINGVTVATNLDVYNEAGGLNKALIKSYTSLTANSTGLTFTFSSTDTAGGNASLAMVSGIIITQPSGLSNQPSSLTAAAGNATVGLSWTAPAGAGVGTTYTVYRNATGTFTPPTDLLASGITTTSYTDNAVVNDTTYYYAVTATPSGGSESGVSNSVSATPSDPGTLIRINAGGSAYTGSSGSWLADTYSTGGSAHNFANSASITGNSDTSVFSTVRFGNSFGYAIPVVAGSGYSVDLYFCEGNPAVTAGVRKFNIAINGGSVATNVDIASEAGGANKALIKTYSALTATSAGLVIDFTAVAGTSGVNPAMVSGIVVHVPPAIAARPSSLSASPGNNTVGLTWTAPAGAGVGTTYTVYRNATGTFTPPTDLLASGLTTTSYSDNTAVNNTTYYYAVTATPSGGSESGVSNSASATPVNPASQLRINAGGPGYTGPNGAWLADAYSSTGSTHNFGNAGSITGTTDPAAYSTVRYGTSFTYTIPVAAGAGYGVHLYFAEGNTSFITGSRKFNVVINGVTVATNLDIYNEAGGYNKALIKSYSGITANGSGLTITFSSTDTGGGNASLAMVSGIGIVQPGGVTNTPTSLTASAGNATVGLTWTAPVGAGVGTTYSVYRNATGTFTPPTDLLASGITTTSYTDNTAVNDTTYYYAVTATPSGGSESGVSGSASATPTNPAQYTRINAGGPAYSGPNGAWLADTGFTGGSTHNWGNAGTITGTNDPTAFSTVRYGNNFTYTISATAGSGYSLQALFVEGNAGLTTGDRKFNILINGVSVATNVDVFAEAGGVNKALTRTFNSVTVPMSGTLTVQFVAVAGNGGVINPAMVSGLVLVAP